ncbi:MAG: hypothetical protein HZB30_03975 [Nitrospirae bacterium]|nr:hypothetical protein [Nitrospirota bacterium]
MANNGYEIVQYSLCEGWVNNLYDGNDDPYVFTTIEEAIAELQEEYDDWQAEIEAGERGKDYGYDIRSFQIICNATGVMYELDLIEAKVIVTHGFSFH